MDADLKKRWCDALRSGEYKQGTGQLRKGDTYCCLGVLAVVAGLEITPDGYAIEGSGQTSDYEPLRNLVGGSLSNLYNKNDDGVPFTEIADYIEEHY